MLKIEINMIATNQNEVAYAKRIASVVENMVNGAGEGNTTVVTETTLNASTKLLSPIAGEHGGVNQVHHTTINVDATAKVVPDTTAEPTTPEGE